MWQGTDLTEANIRQILAIEGLFPERGGSGSHSLTARVHPRQSYTADTDRYMIAGAAPRATLPYCAVSTRAASPTEQPFGIFSGE